MLLLVIVTSSIKVFAQHIDDNPMLRYYMDNTFSRLDKSNISTGLLADYAIDLIEWSKSSAHLPLLSDNMAFTRTRACI